MPVRLRGLCSEPRLNGLNSVLSVSGGIGAPALAISSTAWPSARVRRMTIGWFGSPWWRAFDSRFEITWPSRPPSASTNAGPAVCNS